MGKYKLKTKVILIIIFLSAVLIALKIYKAQSPTEKENMPIYGISIGSSLTSMTASELTNELQDIRATGFTAVRFDVPWNLIQPNNQKSYTWTKFDNIFHDVKRAGLTPLPILDDTPLWARPADCRSSELCAPAHANQFALYAAAVVRRYTPEGAKNWEIWNEQNTVDFWKPAPNPSAYAQLLRIAYGTIKHQNPSAIVLVGGLSGSASTDRRGNIDSRTFLSMLYKDKVNHYFDGVAFHPYTNLNLPNDQLPNNGWSKMADLSPSIRSIMISNGDETKKIWITEMGVPTNGPGYEVNAAGIPILPEADHVSQQLQALTAQQALSDVKKENWISSFFWYSYKDMGISKNSTANFYGLVKLSGAKKPAYAVFYDALHKS
jgi:hypothetical protein